MFMPAWLIITGGLLMQGAVTIFILPYTVLIPFYVWLGYVFATAKKIAIPTVSIIFSFVIGLYIYPNLLIIFSDFQSRQVTPIPKITFYNEKGKEISFDKTKVIALDFWNSGCGVCFEKMPELEKYYLTYKDDPNVEIYSVGVPYPKKETIDTLCKIAKELNYKFPTIYMENTNVVKDSLHQNGYPFLMIIKNDSIRYLGGFNTDKELLMYRADQEIERLLNKEKRASYLYRTATTEYPCFVPDLGEFIRSWSYKTCPATKVNNR